MQSIEQRKNPRIKQRFQVKFLKQGLDLTLDGITANFSQKGALIWTKHWRFLQAGDSAVFTFFLPPDFTGQNEIVGLHGPAVITRVDQENEGIGIEFIKSLKQFESVTTSDVAGKIRYRKLAYYLADFEDSAFNNFIAAYPNGFLVEKSERLLDKSVMFQFLTDVVEDKQVLEQVRQGNVRTPILDARVIEIRKRKEINHADSITIGRSPENDIVVYNKMASRRHAYLDISRSDGICILVDIGSTNGTFLNDSQIAANEKYPLTDADEISIGPETKVVYFSSSAFHTFLSELKPSKP